MDFSKSYFERITIMGAANSLFELTVMTGSFACKQVLQKAERPTASARFIIKYFISIPPLKAAY
jgi:hypothetical protein